MPPLAEALGLLSINAAQIGIGWGIIRHADPYKCAHKGLNVAIIVLSLLLGIKGVAIAFHLLFF